MSRRTLLKSAAVAGGAVALGGLLAPPAFAQTATMPMLGTLSRGYPAALDTGRSLIAFGIIGRKAYHKWWDAGRAWEDWVMVRNSPDIKSRPIPLLNANGAMSLFTTDMNGQMLTAWQATPGAVEWNWSNLSSPNGIGFVEEPFPVLNVDNAMSLFARATDGVIYHSYQKGPGGPWQKWEAFPTNGVGRPWAVIGPTGGMVVFARGRDGGVVHRWQSFAGDTFKPADSWAAIPGRNAVNEDVTAVVNPNGAITVFAGSAGGVAYTWQTKPAGDWLGSWNEWTDNKILGRPSVLVGPSGGMAVFAKRAGATEENQLIHRSQSEWGSNWSNWVTLEDVTTGEPSGVLGRDGRLSAFARTSAGHMVHRMQTTPGSSFLVRDVFTSAVLEVG